MKNKRTIKMAFFGVLPPGALLLLLALTGPCQGEENSSFKWLTPLIVDARAPGVVRILYNEKLTKVLDETQAVEDIEIVRVLRTKVDAKSPHWYLVEYDEGPSEDPAFSIYRIGEGDSPTLIDRLLGLELVIPGNGFVYVSGHTNNMFDERKKYKLEGDSLIEVPQPFRYVGITAPLRRPIVLYSSKDQKQEVARVPAGAEVTVLLNEDAYYLIKTPFGLVGWWKLIEEPERGFYESTPIPGLYYAGD